MNEKYQDPTVQSYIRSGLTDNGIEREADARALRAYQAKVGAIKARFHACQAGIKAHRFSVGIKD